MAKLGLEPSLLSRIPQQLPQWSSTTLRGQSTIGQRMTAEGREMLVSVGLAEPASALGGEFVEVAEK